MKHKLVTYLAAALMGAFAFVGSSHAGETIYTHGAAFQHYTAGQADDIDYLGRGVRVTAASSRYVIASLAHTNNSLNNGLGVYIRGRHNGQSSTSCTVYAYDIVGNLLGSASATTTVNNTTWNLFFPVVASGNLANAQVSALCYLSGGAKSEVFGAVALAY